jgi:hypothetical protein
MAKMKLAGVVRNGQVVLDPPLEVPDGTVVMVTDFDPTDAPGPTSPTLQLSEQEFAELTLFLTGKKGWEEWPQFEARLKSVHGAW